MENLISLDLLTLREKRTYEGFPTERKAGPLCCLVDSSEQVAYYVVPEKDGAASFTELRKARTFRLSLIDESGIERGSFEKRAGFFGDSLAVFDAGKQLLGSIQKQGASRSHFRALDAADRVLYEVEGSVALPEVFSIRQAGGVVGKISRRPAKFVEAGIPKNDHFGIIFPFAAGEVEKNVLLGALLLIDLLF